MKIYYYAITLYILFPLVAVLFCFLKLKLCRYRPTRKSVDAEEVIRTMNPVAYNKMQIKKHKKEVKKLLKKNNF